MSYYRVEDLHKFLAALPADLEIWCHFSIAGRHFSGPITALGYNLDEGYVHLSLGDMSKFKTDISQACENGNTSV